MSKLKKDKKNIEPVTTELNDKEKGIQEGMTTDEQTQHEEEYVLLIESGQAEKKSQKAAGVLTWQLAKSEADNELYLRLIANGSGGLFSKDWVPITKIESVLENQPATGFTSGVFKSLFKGASANNAGFLAAVLRSPDICLLEGHPDKLFTHVLYPDWRARLNKLSAIDIQETITED